MTHIQVNEQTIRRGAVSLILPSIDEAWETYRFRCINGEYPTHQSTRHLAHRLRREMALERAVASAVGSAA